MKAYCILQYSGDFSSIGHSKVNISTYLRQLNLSSRFSNSFFVCFSWYLPVPANVKSFGEAKYYWSSVQFYIQLRIIPTLISVPTILSTVSNKYFLRLTKVVGGLDFSILPYWKRKEDLIYITDKIKVEESGISRTTWSVCWPGMRGWCWGWEPQWTRWRILLISQRSPATYTLRRASMSSSGNDNYMRCTALILSYIQYWSNHSLIEENCPFSLECIDKTSSNMLELLEWTSTVLVASNFQPVLSWVQFDRGITCYSFNCHSD